MPALADAPRPPDRSVRSRKLAVDLSDRIPYQAQIDRPKLSLPDGKKLAVWVILNVEEWRIENAMPRTVLSPPMGQPLLPDVPNWSWHEYGMRAGFWWQFKARTERNIPTTLAINGNVFNSYPGWPRRRAMPALSSWVTASFKARRISLITRPTRFVEPSMPSPPSPEASHAPGKARASPKPTRPSICSVPTASSTLRTG